MCVFAEFELCYFHLWLCQCSYCMSLLWLQKAQLPLGKTKSLCSLIIIIVVHFFISTIQTVINLYHILSWHGISLHAYCKRILWSGVELGGLGMHVDLFMFDLVPLGLKTVSGILLKIKIWVWDSSKTTNRMTWNSWDRFIYGSGNDETQDLKEVWPTEL